MTKKAIGIGDILSRLLFAKKMRATELAREIDVPQPTLHRITTGKSPRPHKSTLEPIADYFDISIDQLTGRKPLPESVWGDAIPAMPRKVEAIEIPFIQWEALLDLEGAIENPPETIFGSSQLGGNCFAVRMNDSSMEPVFEQGCVLICNRDKKPTDRLYVLVRYANSEVITFRQLVDTGEHRFLKPLSADLSTFPLRLLEDEDTILGTLVETRLYFGD